MTGLSSGSRRAKQPSVGPHSRPNRAQAAHSESVAEHGSVMMAILIIMVITLLGAAAMTASQSSLRVARIDNERATALAGAERGLAEALARLDNGDRPPFRGGGSLAEGEFAYSVELGNDQTALVYAVAKANQSKQAIEATIALTNVTEEPYTLLAQSFIVSDTNLGRVAGRVGTNGTLKFAGTAPGDIQELFSPNGLCDACPNPLIVPGPLTLPEPNIPRVETQPCLDDQLLTGQVDGKSGIPMVCIGGVRTTFRDDVTIVNPPLILYVGPNRDLRMTLASVNMSGDPDDLQIYVQSKPTSNALFYFADTKARATIYAPGRSVEADQFDLTGTLTVGSFTTAPGTQVNLRPPPAIQVIASWQVISWKVVPPA